MYYRGIMKSISTKKLALISFVSIFLGVSLLIAAALKRQHAADTMVQVLFTYNVLGRNGIFLIIFGVLVAIFAAGRIITRDTKTLLVSSAILLIVGDLLIFSGLRKLNTALVTLPIRDGNVIDYYEYTFLPIAFFIFALGAIAFLIVARRLFLNKNSRKNSGNIPENSDSVE